MYLPGFEIWRKRNYLGSDIFGDKISYYGYEISSRRNYLGS